MIKKTTILITIMCAFLTKYSFTQILNKNIKEIVVSSNRAQSNENISNIQIIDSIEIKMHLFKLLKIYLNMQLMLTLDKEGVKGYNLT